MEWWGGGVMTQNGNDILPAKMKTTLQSLGAVILGGGMFICWCAKKQMASFESLKNPELGAQLKSFVAEKEEPAKQATNKITTGLKAFFAKGDKEAMVGDKQAF